MSLSSVKNLFSNPSVNTRCNAVGLVKGLTTVLYGLAIDSFNNAGLYTEAKVAATIGCSVVSLLLLNHEKIETLCHDDTGYFKPVLKKAASALGLGTGSLIAGMYLQNLPLMITGAAINVASHAYSFMKARKIVQFRSKQAEQLIQELSQFYEFRALYEEAYKVTVELGLPPPEVRLQRLKHEFNAEQHENIIRIAPNIDVSDLRGSVLMEFGNLVQEKKFREVREADNNGVYKSDEEFARAMECIEYISVLRWRSIAKAINNRQTTCKVEIPWEDLPLETMGFDHYYKYCLADHHKEYYRKAWRERKASQRKIDQPITTFSEFYNAHIRKARIACLCAVAVAAIAATLFDYYKDPYSIR